WNDRNADGAATNQPRRTIQEDIVHSRRRTEGYVAASVVHVVALNAVIRHAEAAANHGLACTAHVIGKPNTRSKSTPMILDKPLGGPACAVNPKSIGIEQDTRDIGIGRKGSRVGAANARLYCWAVGVENRRQGRIVTFGVEGGQPMVGFVGMRNTIPTQS